MSDKAFQNILIECFGNYCPLISPKRQHCRNFGLLPAMQPMPAEQIPISTTLTAASQSQSKQITTHCKWIFEHLFNFQHYHRQAFWWSFSVCWRSCITIIIMINLESLLMLSIGTSDIIVIILGITRLLLGGCLAYQHSSCFFSFLRIRSSLARNVLRQPL